MRSVALSDSPTYIVLGDLLEPHAYERASYSGGSYDTKGSLRKLIITSSATAPGCIVASLIEDVSGVRGRGL